MPALFALLVAMVAIQGGASLAKSLFPLVGAEGATALRLGLASAILLIVFRPWRTPISRGSIPILLVYGAALSGMNLLFYMSLKTLPLAVAVGLEFVGPLGLALAQSRRPIDLLWVSLAFTGILLLLGTHGTDQRGFGLVGALLALSAGVCWATYIAVGKRAADCGRQAIVAYGTTIAAIVAVPIGIVQAGSDLLMPHVYPIAIGVALLTSALPYSLEIYALQRLPTRVFSILTSIEPVIAATFGAIILGEGLSLAQMTGICAIVLSSIGVLANYGKMETSVIH